MMRPQFSLLLLFVMLTLCCLWAAMASWLGLPMMVALTVIYVGFHLPLIWICLLVVAPEATKYITVLGGVGAIILTLATCGILQSRHTARKFQCQNNLRTIGLEMALSPNSARNKRNAGWTIDDCNTIAPAVWVDFSTNSAGHQTLTPNLYLTNPADVKFFDLQSGEPLSSE